MCILICCAFLFADIVSCDPAIGPRTLAPIGLRRYHGHSSGSGVVVDTSCLMNMRLAPSTHASSSCALVKIYEDKAAKEHDWIKDLEAFMSKHQYDASHPEALLKSRTLRSVAKGFGATIISKIGEELEQRALFPAGYVGVWSKNTLRKRTKPHIRIKEFVPPAVLPFGEEIDDASDEAKKLRAEVAKMKFRSEAMVASCLALGVKPADEKLDDEQDIKVEPDAAIDEHGIFVGWPIEKQEPESLADYAPEVKDALDALGAESLNSKKVVEKTKLWDLATDNFGHWLKSIGMEKVIGAKYSDASHEKQKKWNDWLKEQSEDRADIERVNQLLVVRRYYDPGLSGESIITNEDLV